MIIILLQGVRNSLRVSALWEGTLFISSALEKAMLVGWRSCAETKRLSRELHGFSRIGFLKISVAQW